MIATDHRPTISLEAFLENPIDHIEWIDGHLVENSEMTAKTGRIQARLAYYWRNHLIASGQGGEGLHRNLLPYR